MATDTETKRQDTDPNIPVGNSPPTGPWLLILAATAWLAGLAFLLVMASWRLQAG